MPAETARQPARSHTGLQRHLERFSTTALRHCQPLAHRGHGGTVREHCVVQPSDVICPRALLLDG